MLFLSHSMSLILHDTRGASKDFQDSVTDLRSIATFVKATVREGTWIFYKFKDFNNTTNNQQTWRKTVKPSKDEVDISDFNGSVFLLPQKSEGIVLFQHAHYGGPSRVIF